MLKKVRVEGAYVGKASVCWLGLAGGGAIWEAEAQGAGVQCEEGVGLL